MDYYSFFNVDWYKFIYFNGDHDEFIKQRNNELKKLENKLFRMREYVEEWKRFPLPLQIVMDNRFSHYCEITLKGHLDRYNGADEGYMQYARHLEWDIFVLEWTYNIAPEF